MLTREQISLSGLNAEERRFLGELFADIKKGASYLALENRFMDKDSVLLQHARRLGKPVSQTVLYRVCEDIATRLGIRQGYLVRDQIVPSEYGAVEQRRELTSSQVAQMAGCSRQAVFKAIRTGRLRARRVGKISYVWEKDAEAFAISRKSAALAAKGAGRLVRKGGI